MFLILKVINNHVVYFCLSRIINKEDINNLAIIPLTNWLTVLTN